VLQVGDDEGAGDGAADGEVDGKIEGKIEGEIEGETVGRFSLAAVVFSCIDLVVCVCRRVFGVGAVFEVAFVGIRTAILVELFGEVKLDSSSHEGVGTVR
jgi:hypothetical protein